MNDGGVGLGSIAAHVFILVHNDDLNMVFGKFSGYFVLDDGTKIEVKDAYGFAEKVYNKW